MVVLPEVTADWIALFRIVTPWDTDTLRVRLLIPVSGYNPSGVSRPTMVAPT
jgi:hypothetical protein